MATTGNKLQDCAILYRSNAQSRILEEKLISGDLAYKIYGGQRFYERAEIRTAIAYLKLAANPNSNWAISRTINTPTRGIGNTTIEKINEYASINQLTFWESIEAIINDDILPARASSNLRAFVHLVNQLQELEYTSLSSQTDRIIQASGLDEHYKKLKDGSSQSRIENLEELVNATYQFETHNPDASLTDFLNNIALDSGDDEEAEQEDCVQLMTLHTAKGLEFPVVFLSGLEEGLFPHAFSADDPAKLEEERRLCYVGITRAMQELYLSYAKSRRMHGKEMYNEVSRFVTEIPDNLLNKIELKVNISRPSSYAQQTYPKNNSFYNKQPKATSNSFTQDTAVPTSSFQIGSRVQHKVFGKGKIVAYQGAGQDTKVEVAFATKGKKWLLLNYAKLEHI